GDAQRGRDLSMFARITWSKLANPQAQTEAARKRFQERILPSMRTQDGFLGAVLLANSATGEGASVTYWQTAEAMAASETIASAWNTAADREASESVTGGLRRQAADLAQSQAGVRVTLYETILSEVSPAAQQAASAAAKA